MSEGTQKQPVIHNFTIILQNYIHINLLCPFKYWYTYQNDLTGIYLNGSIHL